MTSGRAARPLLLAALLAAAAPAGAAGLRLAPAATLLQGNYYFTFSGGWSSVDDPLRFRSKLDFPFDCMTAGARLSYAPAGLWQGWGWRFEAEGARSVADLRSWGADSDWVYQPVTPGSAVYDTQFLAGVESRDIPAVTVVRAGMFLGRVLGRGLRAEAGPRYRWLHARHLWKGFRTTSAAFNEYWAPYDDTIVMDHRVTCHLVSVAAAAGCGAGPCRARVMLEWMPRVWLSYHNDHPLRYMVAEGDNRGHGVAVSATGAWPLPGRMSWMTIEVSYEYLRARTTGSHTSFFVDDPATLRDESLMAPATLGDEAVLSLHAVTLAAALRP